MVGDWVDRGRGPRGAGGEGNLSHGGFVGLALLRRHCKSRLIQSFPSARLPSPSAYNQNQLSPAAAKESISLPLYPSVPVLSALLSCLQTLPKPPPLPLPPGAETTFGETQKTSNTTAATLARLS